jgi:hypothetical protein
MVDKDFLPRSADGDESRVVCDGDGFEQWIKLIP